MIDPWKSRGATLLHVLLLVVVLSSILVTEIRSRKQQSRSWALDYTVAQTEMLLNEAFFDFNLHKSWPDCDSWLQQTRNGWGAHVYCEYASPVGGTVANRDNAREFLIRQYIPAPFGAIYQGRYRGNEVANASYVSGHDYPGGFVAYTVRTNRYGGANQTIDLVHLSEPGPATSDVLACLPTESHHSFLALSGIASEINAEGVVKDPIPSGYPIPLPCTADKAIPQLTVRNGFVMKVVGPPSLTADVGYDMYRQKYGMFPLVFDGSSSGITSNFLEGDWGCGLWPPHLKYVDDSEKLDGNYNANHEVRGDPITAMVFQYCR